MSRTTIYIMGPNVPTAKSLCASTVAFRPGSDIGEVTPDPSVDVSAWGGGGGLMYTRIPLYRKIWTDPLI